MTTIMKKDGKIIGLSVPEATHQVVKSYCTDNGLIFSYTLAKLFCDLFMVELYFDASTTLSTNLLFNDFEFNKKVSTSSRRFQNYKRCVFYIPVEVHKNIKIYCARHSFAMSDLLTSIIEMKFIKNKDVLFIHSFLCNWTNHSELVK